LGIKGIIFAGGSGMRLDPIGLFYKSKASTLKLYERKSDECILEIKILEVKNKYSTCLMKLYICIVRFRLIMLIK